MGIAPLFDAYVMVDWSAANTRAHGPDSIWICNGRPDSGGLTTENLPTRHDARQYLHALLRAECDKRRAVLVGFDFAFGYPSGFAQRLGLPGAPWRAVWDLLAAEITDAPDNRNNRFAVAASLNRRISGGEGPFWGCPTGAASDCLSPRHHRRHAALGLDERRIADAALKGPQPVWKLFGAGAVGSQSLTGIPVLRWLRDRADFAGAIAVWPFETGLRALSREDCEGRIVLAEIYPSLVDVNPKEGEIRDACQVRAIVDYFTTLDTAGKLAPIFAGDPALDAAQRRAIEREESWILGVVGGADGKRTTMPVSQHANAPPPFRAEELEEVGSSAGALLPADIVIPPPHPTSPPPRAERGKMDASLSERPRYAYLRDPEAIYRESEKRIAENVDLSRFPAEMHPLVRRLVHAAAEPSLADDLVWSENALARGRAALAAGAPVLVDAKMVAAGIIARHLPAKNDVRCSLADRRVPGIARRLGTTRSAAAVELWRPRLQGSIVAIGNAPTALFHLLEVLAAGAPRPSLVLGFPVGFVGAAEAKAALVANRLGLAFITLSGRRGGSALAAAAVNALARAELAT